MLKFFTFMDGLGDGDGSLNLSEWLEGMGKLGASMSDEEFKLNLREMMTKVAVAKAEGVWPVHCNACARPKRVALTHVTRAALLRQVASRVSMGRQCASLARAQTVPSPSIASRLSPVGSTCKGLRSARPSPRLARRIVSPRLSICSPRHRGWGESSEANLLAEWRTPQKIRRIFWPRLASLGHHMWPRLACRHVVRLTRDPAHSWSGRFMKADGDVKLSEALEKLLKDFFGKMDTDGDGEVTKEEAEKFWGSNFAKVHATPKLRPPPLCAAPCRDAPCPTRPCHCAGQR